MASLAPRKNLSGILFEPLRGGALIACGVAVWVAGAAYCHGYERLLSGGGGWPGSLTWSAIAVVPWFALFEWSKQPQGVEATRRPAVLLGLVVGIAALSVALEYFVDFCFGAVSDRLGLLVMRRLPAIAATILLIALTRRAVLRRPLSPASMALGSIAGAIDFVAAADNYVELHIHGKVTLRRMTMQDAAAALRRHRFVRIHRRYLVNRDRIRSVQLNGRRVVVLDSGQELPVGRAYEPNLTHFR